MELLNSLLFMLNEMSPYILLGFFIAGLMHAFVPQKTFARQFGRDRLAVCSEIGSCRHSLTFMLLRCAAGSHLHAPQWCVAGGITSFFNDVTFSF